MGVAITERPAHQPRGRSPVNAPETPTTPFTERADRYVQTREGEPPLPEDLTETLAALDDLSRDAGQPRRHPGGYMTCYRRNVVRGVVTPAEATAAVRTGPVERLAHPPTEVRPPLEDVAAA